MYLKRSAFSMIELIFVIVILGVLAAVAIPRLSATRNDAMIASTSHAIATAASEVASYAVARGVIENNMSSMSAMIANMEQAGKAKTYVMETHFVMGSDNSCLILRIDDGLLDANLSVELEPLPADSLCDGLVNMFDTSEYPIPLRGARVDRSN